MRRVRRIQYIIHYIYHEKTAVSSWLGTLSNCSAIEIIPYNLCLNSDSIHKYVENSVSNFTVPITSKLPENNKPFSD